MFCDAFLSTKLLELGAKIKKLFLKFSAKSKISLQISNLTKPSSYIPDENSLRLFTIWFFFLKKFPKFVKNKFGTSKVSLCRILKRISFVNKYFRTI